MWKFYPSRMAAPEWVPRVIAVFAHAASKIDSKSNHGVSSDAVLAALRPALVELGFAIESSKKKADKIWRPVLFGEAGESVVAYEVDGFHQELGIILEIEAGRGAMNNADYRDLVRSSLIVDAEFLILGQMLEYRAGKKDAVTPSYKRTRDQLDAIYASERLKLPFKGVLLVGY
jgi:hypothetical protein